MTKTTDYYDEEPWNLTDEVRLERIRQHGRQVWSSDVIFLLDQLDRALAGWEDAEEVIKKLAKGN